MEIRQTETGYKLTRENGQEFDLTFLEMSMVQDYFRKCGWRSDIEEQIDLWDDCISFEKKSRTEFVDEVLEAVVERWENCFSFGDNTIHDMVQEYAIECGIWRDE